MPARVRIGCWAAFWGDTPGAARQIIDGSEVDYLVSDYLSEITMALLARARAKDPAAGFVRDAVDVLAPLLRELHARGIKVITNAGALNPAACAEAFAQACEQADVPLVVAAVEGDDVSGDLDAVFGADPRDMFTGESLGSAPMTVNAYLGARPIAAALGAGADIVVTGRCVDSAVVLGPLLHEFGWGDDDHDLLSAGTLLGHILECGPQCTGGTFTDWASVPGWDDMGFPVAECEPDGTGVITKPARTGGLVTPGTVSEQILYEIGDPGAYLMPDVVCDWRDVRLALIGPDRVHVSGARGSPPTQTYKVTATARDGYRAMASAMFAGVDAGGKARRAGQALVARTERLLAQAGDAPLAEVSIEVVGAGDTLGPEHRRDAAAEAVLKVGVRHERREALEVFASEFAPMALVAQGMSGFFAGRPRVAPAIHVVHLLADKARVPVRVRIGTRLEPVEVAPGDPQARPGTATLPDEGTEEQFAAAVALTVPLRRLAWARSGDKGDTANIGVIARREEFVPVLRRQLTTDRVAAFFDHYLSGDVRRWELPGLHALNFVLDRVLGGAGGTSTLRYDPQGKTYAALLLGLPIEVPAAWDHNGLLA